MNIPPLEVHLIKKEKRVFYGKLIENARDFINQVKIRL